MEFDEVLEWLDQKVREYSDKALSDPEKIVLKGTWESHTYQVIADGSNFSCSYLKQDIGPNLWKKLSVIFNQDIEKKTAKKIIENLFNQTDLIILENITEEPGTYSDDELNFVGRAKKDFPALDRLRKSKKSVLVWGVGGIGKTELAYRYLESRFGDKIISFRLARYGDSANSIEHEIQGKIKQKFKEEPGYNFKESLERFKSKIEEEEWGIWIDNLEPLLDGQGKFLDKYLEYKVFIEQVACNPLSKSFCIITSREMLCEDLTLEPYELKPLSIQDWSQYFKISEKKVELYTTLGEIYTYFVGNALAMKNIRASSLEYRETGLIGFWRDYLYQDSSDARNNIKDLIAYQFDSLKKKNIDVYNLLCRMGCFRYQEVPTVPQQALVELLWDVNENNRSGVIAQLNSSGLVDREEGEFLLHPYIHQEAKTRLISNPEHWREANLVASYFWTSWIKEVRFVEDAHKALQSYYNYVAIYEYEKAGKVIDYRRDNDWEIGESLGCSLYRLGLMPVAEKLIEEIINPLDNTRLKAELFNVLGDSKWMLGKPKDAIESHKFSMICAEDFLAKEHGSNEYSLEYIEAISKIPLSLFNIGLCKIDLFELIEAKEFFLETVEKSILFMNMIGEACSEEVINFYGGSLFEFILIDSYSYLGYLFATQKCSEEALYYIEYSMSAFNSDQYSGTAWGRGYDLIYLGLAYKELGFQEKAFLLYDRVLQYAEASSFNQAKAKASTGMSEIFRLSGDFYQSLYFLAEAIDWCKKAFAKCDLAEAYLQLGITYQAMNERLKADDAFNEAQKIWQEVDAPRQLERLSRIR